MYENRPSARERRLYHQERAKFKAAKIFLGSAEALLGAGLAAMAIPVVLAPGIQPLGVAMGIGGGYMAARGVSHVVDAFVG